MGFLDWLNGEKSVSLHIPKGDVYNMSVELLQAEHLLIAGTTGCGKSTLLNTILTDGLYKGCCYYLVDLKKTELWQYKGLPNVWGYCNEFRQVEKLVDDILYQMDKRFKKLMKCHQKKSNDLHLYLVIDEYADVVNLCPDAKTRKRLENKLMRLASQGRASNCHLILCTQRCTNDILSSKIKSCITTKVGMHTTSAQESRNVIGVSGLEQLPKYGEFMLLSPNYKDIVKGTTPYYNQTELDDRINKYRKANNR